MFQVLSLIQNESSRTVSYEATREFQLQLVEKRVRDEIPDTFLFLEHSPVITRGRGLQWTGVPRDRHMPIPVAMPSGIAFAESERGGDLTYHGPGQLVMYPICKLDGKGFAPHHDVTAFLRNLESLMIEELQARGLPALPRENATGIWVGEADQAKKIASIGIAIRKWVTYHGIAINCVNSLEPFHLISPCGFSPEVMTRLADWIPAWDQKSWREDLESSLTQRLASRLGVFPQSRVLCLDR